MGKECIHSQQTQVQEFCGKICVKLKKSLLPPEFAEFISKTVITSHISMILKPGD
jgi:hypothetical protein